MTKPDYQSVVTSLEQAKWKYAQNPSEGDARKIVTLLDDNGMVWVGIRAWHHTEQRWYNGNDPEKTSVLAWIDLPQPAEGRWNRGQLIGVPLVPSMAEKLDRYERRSESGESLGDLFDWIERAEAAETKNAELVRNEQAYERIIGPKSYQEVADEITHLTAQVAVMKKALEKIIEAATIETVEEVAIAEQALANPPTEAEKLVRLVEAAKTYADHWDDIMYDCHPRLLEAVRDLQGENK